MFDLHIHTCYSTDGKERPEKIAKYLKKKGFRGMAIVDHDTMKGAIKARNEKIENFLIIPGMEIKIGKNHVLAIGVDEEIKSRDEDAIDEIHDKGGIAILAHPFRFYSPTIETDVVEIINGRSLPSQNKRAREYAKKIGKPVSAGSDAHFLWEAGVAYTMLNAESVDEAIDEILKGAEVGGGKGIIHPLKCQAYALASFIRRGFKRV